MLDAFDDQHLQLLPMAPMNEQKMTWGGRGGGGHLAVEKHVLADREAKLVLGGLQGKAEQAGVVAELDLVNQLEGDLLLGMERDQLLPLLGGLWTGNDRQSEQETLHSNHCLSTTGKAVCRGPQTTLLASAGKQWHAWCVRVGVGVGGLPA